MENPIIPSQTDLDTPDAPIIPRLTPNALFQQFQCSPSTSVDYFLEYFHCSLIQLQDALADPEFLLRVKIQSQLTYLHTRIFSQRNVAAALSHTTSIMYNSKKPEVARRAAASLIQAAGLTLLTRPQEAPPAFPPALDDSPAPQLVAFAEPASPPFLHQLASDIQSETHVERSLP